MMKSNKEAKGKSDEFVINRHSGLPGIGCFCNTLKKDFGYPKIWYRQAGMTVLRYYRTFYDSVKLDSLVKSRHSREGGNPRAQNFLKRLDSRLRISGMTAIRKTFYEPVKLRSIIMLLLVLAFAAPLSALAVSYPVQLYHREVRHDKFAKGDTVYLFHSGTAEVKKTIHVDDMLTVYRTSQSCEATPIGIVKVIAFVGETYIKGEVFAGELEPDDIAKKGNVSCLIISAGVCEK
jgi:hypothetical protein